MMEEQKEMQMEDGGKQLQEFGGVFLDKYTLIRPLGKGGEGSVFLAWDQRLQRYVAIKRIRRLEEAGEAETGQTQDVEGEGGMREAEHLRQLQHPMLPVIFDLFEDDKGVRCLVMEYIQGMTLGDYIERNGYVREKQACIWGKQLTEVLTYLHTRRPPVIYRDLKPQNVIVCPDGHLRLVDFGAAYRKNFGAAEERRMAFTPGYGAPEQSGRNGQGIRADERSDIYALGMLLYYMVTGADIAKPPYAALSVREYQPFAGERIEEIIRRCIRVDPEERYQLAVEAGEDLLQCEDGRKHRRRQSFIRRVEKQIWLTEMEEPVQPCNHSREQ